MANLVHTKCPNCGAGIDVDPDSSTATCEYCGSTAQLARKTLFGRSAIPLNLAASGAQVIQIPHARRMIVSLIITFVAIAVFGLAIMFFIRSVMNKATKGVTRSFTSSGSSSSKNSVDMQINNGNTTITIKDGKVVGGSVNGMPIPSQAGPKAEAKPKGPGTNLYSMPMLAKAKFLSAIGGDARVRQLALRQDQAGLDVLSEGAILRYHLLNGAVKEPRRERIPKARFRKLRKKSFSLAKLSMAPVVKIVADAKKRLSGTSAQIMHVFLDRRGKKLEWRVHTLSNGKKSFFRYSADGSFRSAQ